MLSGAGGGGGGGGGGGEFDLPATFGDALGKGVPFAGEPGPSSPPDLPTIQVSPDEKGSQGKVLPRTVIPQKLEDPGEYSDGTKRNFRRWNNLIHNDMQRLFNRTPSEEIKDEE